MAITAKKISRPKKRNSAAKSSTAERIISLAQKHFSRIPKNEWIDMPTDLAINADHYLHGHPKQK